VRLGSRNTSNKGQKAGREGNEILGELHDV
jgi:hypothetical protein